MLNGNTKFVSVFSYAKYKIKGAYSFTFQSIPYTIAFLIQETASIPRHENLTSMLLYHKVIFL